jgi:uncharacterized membrane protein YphA (DoxX/SURF4 family)
MPFGTEQRSSLGWIGALRIITGGLFLFAAIQKLKDGFRGPALVTELRAWESAGRTFSFVKDLLAKQVYSRPGDAATTLVVGELVAGISLFLGLGSRVGGLVGFLLNVAYFLVNREAINLLMAVVNLAVLVSGGGRAFGLDGAIRTRMPRWFLG